MEKLQCGEINLLCVFWGQIQVPVVVSNRIGREIIETEHGNSDITFYGNSFIAGILVIGLLACEKHVSAALMKDFDQQVQLGK